MPRQIKVATLQLDGAVSTREAHLETASTQLATIAEQGADLVVLPANFNTGKTFSEIAYETAESLQGQTMQWLCEHAQTHDIHIAGSYVVVDKDDTYHSAFIVAPDGKKWRYDQQYPYLWERVFHRDGTGIRVADTALGKIGLMIGWDAAHPDLWERYAAKVDLMVVMHDALDTSNLFLQYPDGSRISRNHLGHVAKWLDDTSCQYLHHDLEAQAQWMQVPVVCVGKSGQFESTLPTPFFSVQAMLWGRPSLWERAQNHYADMTLIAPFQRDTCIIGTTGQTQARLIDDGISYMIDTVTLADKVPLPLDQPQPEMSISESQRTAIDLITSGLMTLTYRRGVRRQWGARMAPIDTSTRIWLGVLAVVAGLSAVLSWLFAPKKR